MSEVVKQIPLEVDSEGELRMHCPKSCDKHTRWLATTCLGCTYHRKYRSQSGMISNLPMYGDRPCVLTGCAYPSFQEPKPTCREVCEKVSHLMGCCIDADLVGMADKALAEEGGV